MYQNGLYFQTEMIKPVFRRQTVIAHRLCIAAGQCKMLVSFCADHSTCNGIVHEEIDTTASTETGTRVFL